MAGRYRGVTQRGNGWQLSFTLADGTRRREMVHLPHTRKGEDSAFAILVQVRNEISTGNLDYAKRFPKSRHGRSTGNPKGPKIGLLLESFLSHAKLSCAKSTIVDYQRRVYRHLIPNFGSLHICELTPDLVRNWIRQLSLSNKSINNTLIPLRRTTREAYLDQTISTDPMERVPWLPVRKREPDPFTSSERDLVLSEIGERSAQVRSYFEVAFETGLRTSEQIALNWRDIDFARGQIAVTRAFVRGEFKAPKTAAGRRTIPLSASARNVLSRLATHNRPEDPVFTDPTTGARWSSDQPLRKRYWYPALEAAGVRKRNPYQTRHTYASTRLSAGDNPLLVAKDMGHGDWGMIRLVYGRFIA